MPERIDPHDADGWFDARTEDAEPPPRARRALAVIALGGLTGLVIAVGAISYDRGALPPFRPSIHDRSLADVSRGDTGVRVRGVAHYAGMVELHSKEGAPTTYVYPLLPSFDGRESHVVVRTKRQPDRLLDFETVEVEGIARSPVFLFPMDAWEMMVGRGYRFDDDYVLIESFE